eukprot:c1546_g1_i1.p1 GENE.c1546_g1_i1~~c1546_g1_i1.p1  ORF type:complete len:157 (-),score=35.52 c1546_g1_i1:28-498(-)
MGAHSSRDRKMSDVPPEVLAEYKEAFSLFDRDGSGTINTRDVGIVLRSLGATPTEAEINDIIKQTDGDSMGFDEFLGHITRLMPLKYTSQEVIEAFRIFDKEGNGYVSMNELRHVITSLGEKLTNEEVDEMMREAKVNSQGMLSYVDFVETMMGGK